MVKRVLNRVSTQASRTSTKVHQMCEDFINNELEEKKFMPSDRETFNSIKNILSDNINNVRVQEATLYSDYLRVAGRVDCVADWNNRLSVIDFKTFENLKRKNILRIIFNKVRLLCYV